MTIGVINLMVLQDTREKFEATAHIRDYFTRVGVLAVRSKLLVGDYALANDHHICIDRKQSLLELCSNVTRQHQRFKNEILRAESAGIQLVFLCEHGVGIETLADVRNWENPRLRGHDPRSGSQPPLSGERLFQILSCIQARYGTPFLFCNKAETGKRILELLEGGADGFTGSY